MKLRAAVGSVTSAVLWFSIGVVTALIVAAWPITLEKKIDLSDLLSLATSLLLFLGLNLLLVGAQDRKRAEKDILISLVRHVMDRADTVEQVLSGAPFNRPLDDTARAAIQSAFQQYSNAVFSLAGALESRGHKQFVASLRDAETEYRKVVFGEPYPLRYELWHRRQQSMRYNAVRDNLTSLMFSLNDAN